MRSEKERGIISAAGRRSIAQSTHIFAVGLAMAANSQLGVAATGEKPSGREISLSPCDIHTCRSLTSANSAPASPASATSAAVPIQPVTSQLSLADFYTAFSLRKRGFVN